MNALVLDTHTVVWYLTKSPRLSADALTHINQTLAGDGFLSISSVSILEIIYLVEKDRLPELALERLTEALKDSQARIETVPLDTAVALAARRIPREAVPDMPDRIIAATALHLGVPLVTRDRRIRAAEVETIW